ncbi:MAG: hypothetical protein AB7O44_12575 [Hyphomicrobiaceae bacterium]
MKRVTFAGLAVCLLAVPGLAASPKIDAAVKVFQAVGGNPAKLKIFCDMTKAMDAAGEKSSPEADAKIDGMMKQLGADFETAWNAIEGVDDNSPDGKAYNAALDDLAGKCS